MELKKALHIASQVVDALAPHCDIINVAGSCRREKPEVKDIEIVAIPTIIIPKGMFGDDLPAIRPSGFLVTANSIGSIVKGNARGRYMQTTMETSEGRINLDLFMPEPHDYYRQFAIRTGSADWTTRFIAGGWVKLGWVGTDQGLRLKTECRGERGPDHKMKWKCIMAKAEQTLPPHWKSEEQFFEWLQLKWIHPKYREI